MEEVFEVLETEKMKKKKDKKPEIFFKKMTTKEIIELAEKPDKRFFNKKELCFLLEKAGYKIIWR